MKCYKKFTCSKKFNVILIFLCPVNFQGLTIAFDREVILMGQSRDG